jgi:hypothetical protein
MTTTMTTAVGDLSSALAWYDAAPVDMATTEAERLAEAARRVIATYDRESAP